jgi:hypothetical protein
LGLEFGSEGGRPLLEKSLGTGVCCQEWSWEETAEGAHGEDETALALGHAWCDDAGDLKRAKAIDSNNITHLLLWGDREWDGIRVTLSDVVDEDTDIEAVRESLQLGIIGLVVLGEIHSEDLGLDRRGLSFNVMSEGDELGFGAGDEDEVEALVGELEGIFLSKTIRGAGDDGPGALWTILAQLDGISINWPWDS